MGNTPEGYEPYAVGEAKDIAMVTLEARLEREGIDAHDDDNPVDLIGMADAVVEALLTAGVQVPDDLQSPYRFKAA